MSDDLSHEVLTTLKHLTRYVKRVLAYLLPQRPLGLQQNIQNVLSLCARVEDQFGGGRGSLKKSHMCLKTGGSELATNKHSMKGQNLLVSLADFSLEAQHHLSDLEVQEGLAFLLDLPVENKMRFFHFLLKFILGVGKTVVSVALCCHSQSYILS